MERIDVGLSHRAFIPKLWVGGFNALAWSINIMYRLQLSLPTDLHTAIGPGPGPGGGFFLSKGCNFSFPKRNKFVFPCGHIYLTCVVRQTPHPTPTPTSIQWCDPYWGLATDKVYVVAVYITAILWNHGRNRPSFLPHPRTWSHWGQIESEQM